MLHNIKLQNILFLDVETVPQYPAYKDTPEEKRALWDLKAKYLVKEDQTPGDVYQRAGIYAEFGKIVCITVGYIVSKSDAREFRLKSFYGDDEAELLADFIALLNAHYNTHHHLLCAHNGKEFDFPYMARRILVNGLKLPDILDIAGKKPWEVRHLDTMELWKFGDYKHYTSLNLLANIFGIPTPKDEMDGSDVWRVYWEEKQLDKIEEYCRKDVLTVAQLLLKFKGESLINEQAVVVA